MRFIDKSSHCQEYEAFFQKNEKRLRFKGFDHIRKMNGKGGPLVRNLLFSHLLNEQKGLCLYCEQTIPFSILSPNNLLKSETCHIEHVKPKAVELYPELQFDHENLGISCNGFDPNSESEFTKQFCGHKKNKHFDEEKFINPVEVKDIQDYFQFNVNGEIEPNQKRDSNDQEKLSI